MSTIQDSLTRQQFSMITSSFFYKVYESPAASLSSTASESESLTTHCSHSTVASVQSTADCSQLYIASVVRIRRFCSYYSDNIKEFLRILFYFCKTREFLKL